MVPPHPFRRSILGLALVVVVAALAGVVPLLLAPRSPYEPTLALVSLGIGLAALLVLVVLVVLGQSRARVIGRLVAGEYLVHWRYDMGEWDRFIARERRINRRILVVALALLMGGLLFISAVSLLTGPSPNSADVLFLLVLGVALLVGLAFNVVSPSTYAHRHGAADGTYIGMWGIYRPDGYMALRGRTRKLDRVSVRDGDPPVLVLSLRQMVVIYPVFIPTWIATEYRVPIPFGREDEARALAKRFPLGA